MQKRNFILLIIVLGILMALFFGSLYFQKGSSPVGSNTGTNFISIFNPFGNSKNTGTPPSTTPPTDISGSETNPTPEVKLKLTKVSSMPIAGFTIFTKERLKSVPVVTPTDTSATDTTNTATAPTVPTKKTIKPTPPLTEFAEALRYVDKATGNIYQTFADKIEERKFSTTIIPKVYEAIFGNKGGSVVMRYLRYDNKTIATFVGTIPKEYLGADTTATNEIKGTFLPDNIKDISLSPDGSNIFYLFTSGDNMVGSTLNFLTNKKTQIFSSPFTEWLSQWPSAKTITLNTKPSSGIPGYLYTTDTSSKNLRQAFGDINGLTTLTSPNGKLILYGNDTLSLNVYHADTKNSDLLGVKTIPEKCVWGSVSDVIYCAVPKSINGGQYPDSWYQGEVSFSDQFWKIDIKTGNATIIFDPATINNGEEVDGIKLALDSSENYLFFVNKKDNFLWEYSLK